MLNIIIKAPNFIGDTIMMLPALELIKLEYPNANLTIVCKPYSRDIFRNKGIDKIIIDDTKGKYRVKKTMSLIKEIKKQKYNLGILFHNTFIDALTFKICNINTIIGYDKENRKFLLDFWIKIDRSRHYINHYVNLINKYLDDKYTIIPPMTLSASKYNFIQKDQKPLIGFVLGSDKGTRGYPKNMSLELFKILKNKEFHIVLLGDENDAISNAVYEKEMLGSQAQITNLTGKTTVGEFIDIINELDILVTIDTSSMHIAAATSTRFIVLLGKGSSPFDIVKPKVNFGSYIFKGQKPIKDEELIKQIKPIDIVSEINIRLSSV